MIQVLRIATRESPLALWQANFVRQLLLDLQPDLQIDLLPMSTSGDRFLKDKLLQVGGKGLFVKELEEALLDGRADLAVHSMKDVPAILPQGLNICSILERHNPLDAFLSLRYQSLQDLPQQAIVGTASLRRQSQLLALRPDLEIKTLRGNIQTRMQKLEIAEYDAIILAAAGLERMGYEANIREILAEDQMLPACGQGALGIETRDKDHALNTLLTNINNPLSASCVEAERLVNAKLGGNCHVPLAVFCKPLDRDNFMLQAKVASTDGKEVLYTKQQGNNTIDLAEYAAADLIRQGADLLLGLAK